MIHNHRQIIMDFGVQHNDGTAIKKKFK